MTTIATIRKRQGIPAPITEQQRDEYEQAKAQRRSKNVVNAREILANNQIGWGELPHIPKDGNGVLFRVRHPERLACFDYYPEIGLWIDESGGSHYGCRNLVKYLKGEVV